MLVVATTNRGKLDELRALLEGLPLDVRTLEDVGQGPGQARHRRRRRDIRRERDEKSDGPSRSGDDGADVLADDSGLEVDALGGAPGVRSARFASERATDAENNVPRSSLDSKSSRAAEKFFFPRAFDVRLRSSIRIRASSRTIVGRLLRRRRQPRAPRGTGGFGYDPLFIVEGGDKTMAELEVEEKNRISHRALACLRIRPTIERILVERESAIRAMFG